MKTFAMNDNPGHDLIHMVGSKESYDIVEDGVSGALTYKSKMGDREYVINGNEQLYFKGNDKNGVRKFTWENEKNFFKKKDCKEWLSSGATTDGVYTIKPGDTEFDVYCDMTTDGGGWTNVNYRFGNIIATNTNNGIDEAPSTEFINGPLKSVYTNNGCTGTQIYSEFTNDFMNLMNFFEVKLNVKSYGAGDIRCGGVLRYVGSSDVVKYNTFNTGQLGRCDNDSWYPTAGLGFSEERSTADIHFSYTMSKVDNRFAALNTACSSGTSYLQINSVMVR